MGFQETAETTGGIEEMEAKEGVEQGMDRLMGETSRIPIGSQHISFGNQ